MSYYNVKVVCAGDRKILAIKTVREITGLGLKEAKDIVDGIPTVVESTKAEEFARQLAELNAEVTLTESYEPEVSKAYHGNTFLTNAQPDTERPRGFFAKIASAFFGKLQI